MKSEKKEKEWNLIKTNWTKRQIYANMRIRIDIYIYICKEGEKIFQRNGKSNNLVCSISHDFYLRLFFSLKLKKKVKTFSRFTLTRNFGIF